MNICLSSASLSRFIPLFSSFATSKIQHEQSLLRATVSAAIVHKRLNIIITYKSDGIGLGNNWGARDGVGDSEVSTVSIVRLSGRQRRRLTENEIEIIDAEQDALDVKFNRCSKRIGRALGYIPNLSILSYSKS